MSCPYFWPVSPDPLRRAARAPLGLMHLGTCTQGAAAPDPELCNFGYARGRCSSFPADAPADAVRFDRDRYILERNYQPVEFGRLDGANVGEPIQRQFTVLSAWREQQR